MALRFLESFDHIKALGGTALQTEILKKWSAAQIHASSSVGLGWGAFGQDLAWYNVPSDYIQINLDNQQEWYIGFAFFLSDTDYNDRPIVQFYDATTVQCSLYIRHPNMLTATTGVAGGIGDILLNSNQSLYHNVWQYLEIYVKIANAGGIFTVRQNGVEIFTVTGDTQASVNAYANRIRFCCAISSTVDHCHIDDIYICDGTSGDTFRGPGKIEAILPTSDVTANWSASANAAHYTLVDEHPGNDDTDYVYENASGDLDSFGYADLATLTIDDIEGLQINTQAALSAAGSMTLQNYCKSNGTENTVNHTVASTTYYTSFNVLETDPNTANAWTVIGVNSAEFGVKVG